MADSTETSYWIPILFNVLNSDALAEYFLMQFFAVALTTEEHNRIYHKRLWRFKFSTGVWSQRNWRKLLSQWPTQKGTLTQVTSGWKEVRSGIGLIDLVQAYQALELNCSIFTMYILLNCGRSNWIFRDGYHNDLPV